MPFSERLYKQDVAILKDYGGKGYKITLFKNLMTSGLDTEKKICPIKGTVNDKKLDENIMRARSKIFEYAICNQWDFFCTFTIDPKKYDRNDLNGYHKSFSQFIRDVGKKYNTRIRYLLVPEEHTSGGWHEHGLFSGFTPEMIRDFTLKEHLPSYIRDKLKSGDRVCEWIDYRKKFGFCDLEPVRNHEAVSKYITKYISKTLMTSIRELNAHLYYCSKGLKTATTIKKGSMLYDMKPSFANDYIKVQWFDGSLPLEDMKCLIE